MKKIASAFIALYAVAVPIGAQQLSDSKSEMDKAAPQSLPNQPLGDTFFSCTHGHIASSQTPPSRKLGIAYTMPDKAFMQTNCRISQLGTG